MMYRRVGGIGFMLAVASAMPAAERYRPKDKDQLIEQWIMKQVEMEADDARKIVKIEQFVRDHSRNTAFQPWLYLSLQEVHFRRGECPLAIAAGDKLLALKPDDLQVIHENLQCAEKAKDAALVKRYSDRLRVAARKAADDPAADAESKTYARSLVAYADYLAYVEILQTPEPKKKLALMDAFVKERPQSTYTPQVSGLYFQVYRQSGDLRAMTALAEKIIETDPENEEALLLVAENLFSRDQQQDRVLALSQKIIDIATDKPRPETFPEADWNKRKAVLLTRAYWMTGRIYMDQARFGPADRMLRAALPGLRGNDALTAQALFQLGWANYKTGNLADALRFNQMCMAYKSSFYEQARKNLDAIKAEQGLK